MKLTSMLIVCLASLLAGGAALPAEAQDVRLNVTKPDQYAMRRIVVVKKSGDQITSLVRIQSYDPATASFVMQNVTGEAVIVPASQIKEMVFEQSVMRQSPMAQEAWFAVYESLGPALRYKLPQGSLRVEDGNLVLPASTPSTPIPAPPVPPLPAMPGSGNITTSNKVTEARKLTYDASRKSFLLEVQNVTYTKETSGSSGMSGVRK